MKVFLVEIGNIGESRLVEIRTKTFGNYFVFYFILIFLIVKQVTYANKNTKTKKGTSFLKNPNIILVLVKISIVVKKLFNHLATESQKTLDVGQCKNRCSRDSSDT